MLEIVEFELLAGARQDGGYPLTVVQSPASEGVANCTLDPHDAELADALDALGAGNIDGAFLTQVGAFLFGELFTDDVAGLYRESLAIARSQGRTLRIRLRFDALCASTNSVPPDARQQRRPWPQGLCAPQRHVLAFAELRPTDPTSEILNPVRTIHPSCAQSDYPVSSARVVRIVRSHMQDCPRKIV